MKNCFPLILIIFVSFSSTCQVPHLPWDSTLTKYIGTEAHEFSTVTLRGDSISLNDFIGKPIVLNLWNLRCGACWKEHVDFNKVKSEFPSVVVLSLIEDQRKEVLKKIKIGESEYIIDPPIFKNDVIDFELIPNSVGIMKYYGIKKGVGFPLTYFIDESGIIREFTHGYSVKDEMNPDAISNFTMLTKGLNTILKD